MDYWALAVPRFVQGFGQGFVFVPLQTLALATIRMDRLSNATAAFNVVRNFGGSSGIALATTLLARRSQYHQSTLGTHVTMWSADTTARLQRWTSHFLSNGADAFTAERRALAMLYRDATDQAQVLAYGDVYVLLVGLFVGILLIIPWMRRVRPEHTGPQVKGERATADRMPETAAE